MPITFRVNGESVTVDVPADMPLLWVLRDVLGLKGTKFGCGIAQCGACTVHIDGRVDQSCRTRVSTVRDRDVVTIEGLSPDGSHPLQQAWRDLDVPQCGFCQAGQLMAASALLADNPNPSDAQIDRALNRNLCRCGTYVRIREGIHHAAAAMTDDAPAGGARVEEDDR
ncbi:MAG: (2Fe-2S)-binding protein [Gemmatimonadetes bacterium]|nr:(2Fe-2S)-binding protein [Gemmatimonadota bacterium]MBT8404725.1 (2Fe-2S)-binding protein [Gemmatimonadota bacterium]